MKAITRPKTDAAVNADPMVQELVRILREERPELSWVEFSQISGLPISTLMNWRSGKRKPTIGTLRRAFETLGYTLEVMEMADDEYGTSS